MKTVISGGKHNGKDVSDITTRIFGARPHFWDAYEQGQLARELGDDRATNPWDTAISRSHVNCGDWFRGWDRGAAA